MKFNIKRRATEYRHIMAGLVVLAFVWAVDPLSRASPPIGSAWIELGTLVVITLGAVAVAGGYRTLLDHKRLAVAAIGTATLFILVPTSIELLAVGYEHTIGEPEKIWMMDGATYKTTLESLVDALTISEESIVLALGVTTIVVVGISRPSSREELSSLYWFLLPPTVALISARGVLIAAKHTVRRDLSVYAETVHYVSGPLEALLGLGLVLWIMWGLGLVAYELATRYGVEELSAPGEAA